MAIAKKEITTSFAKLLVLIFFILFPFGQLTNIDIYLFGFSFSLHMVDAVVLLSVPLYYLVRNDKEKPIYFNSLFNFLVAAFFSLLLSSAFFKPKDLVVGAFYLIRLVSYLYFSLVVLELVKLKVFTKRMLANSLIFISLASAIFGWVQYLIFPDLRVLKYIGWDEHYYRLAGSFLDPGFLGVVLVLGFIASFTFYLQVKKKIWILLSLFYLISLLFTYSRASYLALVSGIGYLFLTKFKSKILYLLLFAFIISLPFLPRPGGEGVKLERVQSIINRLGNYSETFNIIKDQPLFGVGYNNLCLYRTQSYSDNYASHACSGSDSSVLLVIATTGIVGFIILIDALYHLVGGLPDTKYRNIVLASGVAVLVNSFFNNSLFYPWVMGWFAILLVLALTKEYS